MTYPYRYNWPQAFMVFPKNHWLVKPSHFTGIIHSLTSTSHQCSTGCSRSHNCPRFPRDAPFPLWTLILPDGQDKSTEKTHSKWDTALCLSPVLPSSRKAVTLHSHEQLERQALKQQHPWFIWAILIWDLFSHGFTLLFFGEQSRIMLPNQHVREEGRSALFPCPLCLAQLTREA